jgi:hypothetical protein
MVIGNFLIDRSSGAVETSGSGVSGEAISEPQEMKALARALVARAKFRVLSGEEAECLVRQTFSDSVSSHGPLLINRVPTGPDEMSVFVSVYRLSESTLATEWHLAVDTSSIAVLESPNGPAIHSPGLDELLSRMRMVRRSPSLSTLEAIEVAVQVPSVLARTSAKCSKLSADEFGTAHDRFVVVEDTCESYPREFRVLAAVDVLNGTVKDPRTRKILDTPGSIALARKFLRAASERQAAATREVDATCTHQ